MKKSTNARPEPVPVNVVCSLCGEAWALHCEVDGEITTLECIRLLKAARGRIASPWVQPYPVYPQPYTPYRVWWQSTTSVSSGNINSGGGQTSNAVQVQTRTPKVVAA